MLHLSLLLNPTPSPSYFLLQLFISLSLCRRASNDDAKKMHCLRERERERERDIRLGLTVVVEHTEIPSDEREREREPSSLITVNTNADAETTFGKFDSDDAARRAAVRVN